MIPRIEDLTAPPVVGRFYLVPCVSVETGLISGRSPGLWPVTGPKHDDVEILEFEIPHWHYDRRFLSNDQFREVESYGSVLNSTRKAGEYSQNPYPIEGVAERPVLASRRCMRDEPGFPYRKVGLTYLPALRDAYCDKTITCGKCPHRGLPLSSLPREPGTDVVTCPGHGLLWDLATGKLVRP